MNNTIAKAYCNTVKEHMKIYYANWVPNSPVKLGDFGVMDGSTFVPMGNINAKGINFTEVADSNESHYFFTSEAGVSFTINPKATIGVTPQASLNANIDIEFSNENTVFFNAAGCKVRRIENKSDVGDEILKMYDNDNWKREYVVVTDLITSGKTLIAVSSNSNSSIVFEAKSPEIKSISLADASLDFDLKSNKSVSFYIDGESGLNLLIGLCKVQKRFLGQPEFKPASAFGFITSDILFDKSESPVSKSELYFGQLY